MGGQGLCWSPLLRHCPRHFLMSWSVPCPRSVMPMNLRIASDGCKLDFTLRLSWGYASQDLPLRLICAEYNPACKPQKRFTPSCLKRLTKMKGGTIILSYIHSFISKNSKRRILSILIKFKFQLGLIIWTWTWELEIVKAVCLGLCRIIIGHKHIFPNMTSNFFPNSLQICNAINLAFNSSTSSDHIHNMHTSYEQLRWSSASYSCSMACSRFEKKDYSTA